MANVIEDFEKDCLVRIERKLAKAHSHPDIVSELAKQEEQFPSATYFLMGVGFGVIAARVACTCIFTRHVESND